MTKYFCTTVLKVIFFLFCAYLGIMLGYRWKIRKESNKSARFWATVNSHSYILLFMEMVFIADVGYMLINKWFLGDIEYIDKLGAMFLAMSGSTLGSLFSKFFDIYNCLKRNNLERKYLMIFSIVISAISVIAILSLETKIYISELMIFLIGILTTMMFDASLQAEDDRAKRNRQKE